LFEKILENDTCRHVSPLRRRRPDKENQNF